MKNCIFCNENRVEIKHKMLCHACNDMLFKKVMHVPGCIDITSDICQMCYTLPAEPYSKYVLCNKCNKKPTRMLSPYIRSDEHRYLMFLDKLDRKYGHEFFENLSSLKENPYTTLDWVGGQHGLTREYVRQLFYKIYGDAYTSTYQENNTLKKIGTIPFCNKDIRNYYEKCNIFGKEPVKYKQIEMLFFSSAKNMGLTVAQKCDTAVDFDVNGFAVDVKHCDKQQTPTGCITPVYRFTFSLAQALLCDFLACYHNTEERFFIIPMQEILNRMKKKPRNTGNTIYISDTKDSYKASQNKWWEYNNAWHLLIEPEVVPIVVPRFGGQA